MNYWLTWDARVCDYTNIAKNMNMCNVSNMFFFFACLYTVNHEQSGQRGYIYIHIKDNIKIYIY
jgi:hypothetical protein